MGRAGRGPSSLMAGGRLRWAALALLLLLLGSLLLPQVALADEPTVAAQSLTVDGSSTQGSIKPYYRGYYDLSGVLYNFSADANLAPLLRGVNAASWRVSIGRWEIGTSPSQAEMEEREYFIGSTLADAQDPTKYNWTYLDKLFAQVSNTGMQPLISIDYMPRGLAKNTTETYIWPGYDFSNGIRNSPPLSNEVFAEVVTRIIMHYNAGWGNGYYRNYQYWELWNEPDLDSTLDPFLGGLFWNGTRQEFFDLYRAVSTKVKAQFGNAVKFGGAAFNSPVNWLPSFLDFVKSNSVPLDFLSYHVYSQDVAVIDYVMAEARYQLSQRGLGSVETILDEWGRNLDGQPRNDWYDTMAQALHHTQSFILMHNRGLGQAHHSIIRDLLPGLGNMGVLFNPAAAKPIYYAYKAFDRLQGTPVRLKTGSSGPIVIAGKDSGNTKLTIVFINTSTSSQSFSLSVRNLPWGSSQVFHYERYLLSDATFAAGENLKLVEPSTRKQGRSLNLSRTLPGQSLSMLVITKG